MTHTNVCTVYDTAHCALQCMRFGTDIDISAHCSHCAHCVHSVHTVHSGLIFTSRGPATFSPTQWADFLGQEIKNKRKDEIIARSKAMPQS